MAFQLLTEGGREALVAPAGDRRPPQEPALPLPVQTGADDEGAEPCDLRVTVTKGRHGATCWCYTHQVLVGAMFGQVEYVEERAAAWRALRACNQVVR